MDGDETTSVERDYGRMQGLRVSHRRVMLSARAHGGVAGAEPRGAIVPSRSVCCDRALELRLRCAGVYSVHDSLRMSWGTAVRVCHVHRKVQYGTCQRTMQDADMVAIHDRRDGGLVLRLPLLRALGQSSHTRSSTALLGRFEANRRPAPAIPYPPARRSKIACCSSHSLQCACFLRLFS